MRYELMYPDQIRRAIDENWPAVLPAGVLEYHAEHCVTGVDTLLVVRAVEILENEMDMVILPPFYYGASSYVVEPPERNGSLQIESEVILPFARNLFTALLRVGFRNIHVFIHHQSENFAAGMPTDLAFKLAGRQAIFAHLERERGESWWGDNKMKDYYSGHAAGDNPFNWIQAHPLMDEQTQAEFPIDHAGKQESSLMLALCPEGIDMRRLSRKKWYCEASDQASIEYGKKAVDKTLAGMRAVLGK